jgi:enoyl-CoA hydratase/carnithine racemase
MKFDDLQIHNKDHVGIITIHRPEVLNALRFSTIREIDHAVSDFIDDPAIRVIVITGSGEKSFVAGADINEFIDLEAEQMWRMMKLGQDVFDHIADCPKPVIAAVNGYALGGGLELALACDIIIASENALFGHPEITVGSFPGWGSTQRLPRRIGLSRAKEMVFTGMKIDAQRAEAIGLVNHVHPPAQLLEETLKLASQITDKSAKMLAIAKSVLNASESVNLKDGQNLEAFAVSLASVFDDRKEGVRAFFEKRKPRFNRETTE